MLSLWPEPTRRSPLAYTARVENFLTGNTQGAEELDFQCCLASATSSCAGRDRTTPCDAPQDMPGTWQTGKAEQCW
jgi:hypothetical protein